MQKTAAEQDFEFLVSNVIWPHFKPKGYKKLGNNFRYYDNSGWGKVVNFQKSVSSSKTRVNFTVNIGFYLPEAEEFISGARSEKKFQELVCIVRKRIGYITEDKTDLWFVMGGQTDKTSVFEAVEQQFKNSVIPYMDAVNSREDILNILRQGHRSEYRASQIQTLYSNGYKDDARQLLEDTRKKVRDVTFLQKLERIEEAFKD